MAYEGYGNQREDDMEQLLLQQELGGEPQDVGPITKQKPVADAVGAVGDSLGSALPDPAKNTGVAGGVDTGGVAEQATASPDLAAAFKKSKAEGYTDIEGAGGLKTGDYMGALEGFNTGAWGSGERGSNTLKNSFGKIASRYDPTQAGAAKALMSDPDFMSMFPDAYIVEHPNQDLIDFDGPGGDPPVDVIRGATAGGGGAAWQWGTQDGGGGGAAGGGLEDITSGGAPQTDVEGLMNSDVLAQIQKEIEQLMAGGGGGDEQALVQQILGA